MSYGAWGIDRCIPVILVANLVLPGSEAAPGENIFALEIRQRLGQGIVTLEARRGIPVIEAANVGADDLVFGVQQAGVDEPLDAVLEQRFLLDGLVRGLGDFEHDGPVGSGLRSRRLGLLAVGELLGSELDLVAGLVEWAVVGEYGRPVERTIVLDEIELFGNIASLVAGSY